MVHKTGKKKQSINISILSCLILLISGFLTESSAAPAWRLIPSLSISETYNSNIFSSSDETGDFITGTGASFKITYTGTNTELKANYTTTWSSYANNTELNVLTHDGNINIDMARGINSYFRDVRINVSEGFSYSPDSKDYYFDVERGGDASLSNYGIRTERNDAFRNAASIDMSLPLSRNQGMNLRYSNLLTEFSDPVLQDNMTNSLSIGTYYTARKDTLHVDIGIMKSTADEVDLNSYSITTGLRHKFSPVTQGEFSIGWDMIDYEAGKTSNVRGTLNLSRTSEFITYYIGYSRDLNTVSGVKTTSPVVSQTAYINMSVRHTRLLSSTMGATYSINQSLNGDEVDIKSYNLSAEANYTIRTWLTGSFSVSHFAQNSGVASAMDIERNLLMLKVSASWGT